MRFFILAFLCAGCTSMKEAGRIYFYQKRALSSVESPQQLFLRFNNNRAIVRLLYSPHTQDVLTCSLLRNQLLSAYHYGLSGREGKMIEDATLRIEQAFQEDKETFFQVCDDIKKSEVGKIFIKTQYDFLNQG